MGCLLGGPFFLAAALSRTAKPIQRPPVSPKLFARTKALDQEIPLGA